MKVAKLAVRAVLVGGLLVGAARAQSPGEQLPADPAHGYAQAQDAAASPSDAPGVASAESVGPSGRGVEPGVAVAESHWPSDLGGYYGSCPPHAGADEPFRIFGRHDSGIEVGGWISVGGYANQFGESRNGPLGFNTVGDGVNVHQLWGYMAKETETHGLGADWGARVDYVFGIDGPDTQAVGGTGWDSSWDTGRDYGSAIPQAYAEIAVNYLTVKAGYFFTPLGYERVQAPENFFYSHSYTHYYVEPFTHTGALATYDGIEDWTFYGGWTTGWDAAWEMIGDSNMFLGGATYHLGDDLAVTYMTSAGQLDSLAAG
ncbi:MAG: outer membrane beta-barrel protein, partial [Thermoguttaceae bacterium]|nr:outer membrane beta-barrel protein [Thermoguttaceae bacterium]